MYTTVITFANHSPIRVSNPEHVDFYGDFERVNCVWDARRSFGHHTLYCYTTQRGKQLYWISRNSGESYFGRDPVTIRTYLPSVKAIKDYFADCEMLVEYHTYVEKKVDPNSILDIDGV